MDLLADPWTASGEDLLAAWMAAMAHLEPAGVFAKPVYGRPPPFEHSPARYEKGPNCVIGGVVELDVDGSPRT